MTDTKTYPHAKLARIVSTFTLGAIGDRVSIRKRAAEEALELTQYLDDTAPEKMLAYALEYGSGQAEKRLEAEAALLEAKDLTIRLQLHQLTSAVAEGRKRILPLLEDHDRTSAELEALGETLRDECLSFAGALSQDFYLAEPEDPRQERLERALRKIRDARDFYAEHQEWPASGGPGADQGFDDWAADLADEVL